MIDLCRPAPPARASQRDWFAPAVIAASLLVHGAIVASLIWSPRAEAARPPVETPVEVVQQMPEPPKPPPKAVETKQPAPPPKAKPEAQKQIKPEAQKQARSDPPKPAAAKPPTQKTAAAKPAAAKSAAAKSAAAKSAAAKSAAAKPAAAKPAAQKTAAKSQPAPKPQSPTPAQQDVAERMQKLIGPMPAYALPALGSGDSALDDGASYKQIVLGRVAAQKREGRHEGVPGHVIVAFAIGDHGEVVSCEIREKSADPALDAEAVAMVQRAAPYPPPPPGAPREFTFGLRFQIL